MKPAAPEPARERGIEAVNPAVLGNGPPRRQRVREKAPDAIAELDLGG